MMLLQIQNFRLWMKSKMGQRGAAITEYVVLLAFVCVIGYALLDNNGGLSSKIDTVIGNVKALLDTAASRSSK